MAETTACDVCEILHPDLSQILRGEIEPDETGCILWPGRRTGDGYAQVMGVSASRLILTALVGPPPTADHQAAHAPHDVCGNRHCVNVEHLRWATPREQADDQRRDGTTNQGERHGRSKLTEDQAREIRVLYSTGDWTQQEIADRFGISRVQVSRISRGTRWTHLEAS